MSASEYTPETLRALTKWAYTQDEDVLAHAVAWEAEVARLRELLDDARHGRWGRSAEMDAAIKQRPGN